MGRGRFIQAPRVFNQACEDWGAAKAAYHFFQNDKFSEQDLLNPHFKMTADKCKNLGQVNKIDVIQGMTVIFSSNSNQYIDNLEIKKAVGRTLICGVKIGRLELKAGRLELVEGAQIISLGSSKGRIIVDETSSILEVEQF